jgi:hypothetical protein
MSAADCRSLWTEAAEAGSFPRDGPLAVGGFISAGSMARHGILAGGVLCLAAWLPRAVSQDVPATQPGPPPATQPTTQPAAEAGAAAPAETRRLTLLDLRHLAFELGVEAAYDARDVKYAYNPRNTFERTAHQRDKAWRIEEIFGVSAAGALFDERIAQFDVMARYGLSQEGFSETGPALDRGDRPHGDLFEYDINMDFLPRGTLSGNAYAQRLTSRVPRTFLPSLDRSLERYGGGLYLNSPTFPMRFTFEHTWEELTSRTGDLNDDEQRGENMFRYEGTWQISKNQSLRAEYEYADRHERYSGSKTKFDTTRNYLTLDHVLRFGPDDRSSWETLARIQAESGDLARDNDEVSTRLRLQHTDSFATNYAVQYVRDSYQELSTETARGEVGFTHQLRDLVTTTVQFYGLQQQANDNADFGEWGALVNAAYSQENALGRLSASVAYNHTSTETRNGDQKGIVIGESVTFRDPLGAYLAQTDVDLASLVVTDANRARTFLPARDYIAVKVGRYTSLHRVPTGQIADRQTVLVTYAYRVMNDYSVRRERFDVRIQQDFKSGFSPYYAGSFQDESRDTQRYMEFSERDVMRHRLGVTYRQKLWSAGLEYEYNDDSIDPYQAMHANGDVVLWQRGGSQLDGKATLSHFRFWGGGDDLDAHTTTLMDLGAAYRHLLARDLEATASALYRYENDSLAGITNGVDLSGALDWRIGYFTLRFEAEYDLLSLPDSTDNGASFWIKLKRDIPVINKGAR